MKTDEELDQEMVGIEGGSNTPSPQAGPQRLPPQEFDQSAGQAPGFSTILTGHNPQNYGYGEGSSHAQQYSIPQVKTEDIYTSQSASGVNYEPFTFGINSNVKLEGDGIGQEYWDEEIKQFSTADNRRATLIDSEGMLFADPGRASNDDFAWLTGRQLVEKYPNITQRQADDAMKLIKANNGSYYPEAQYYNSITAPGSDFHSTSNAYRQQVYREKMQSFGVTPINYSGAVFNRRTGQYQLTGADAYIDSPGGKRYRNFQYKYPNHAGVDAPDLLYKGQDGTFRGRYRHEKDEFTGKSPEDVKAALRATSLHLKSATNIYHSTEVLGPERANTRLKGYVNESRAHNKDLPKAVIDIGSAHIDVKYILTHPQHSKGALAQRIMQRDPDIILRTRVLMPGGNTYMPVTRLKQMSEKNADQRYGQALNQTMLPRDFGFIDWRDPANQNRPRPIRDNSAVLVHMDGMLMKGEALQKALGPGKTIAQYASRENILVQSQQKNRYGQLYGNGNYKNLADLQDHQVPAVAAAMIQGRQITPEMQYGQWAQQPLRQPNISYQPRRGDQSSWQNTLQNSGPPSRQQRGQYPQQWGSQAPQHGSGQPGPQGYYGGSSGEQQQRDGYSDSQQETQKGKQRERVFNPRARNNSGWGL